MANKRELKKDINYVLGDIIEAVYYWELENSEKPTKESEAIIDEAIASFDELIARVNDRSVENTKAHFKAINNDLESKGRSLIERINKRVHQMFERGAIKEVKKFNRLKIKKENSSNKIIGIMEITNYLHGKSSLNETKEQIVVKTRQYAKRQSTWARGQMMSWQKIEHKNQILALKKI